LLCTGKLVWMERLAGTQTIGVYDSVNDRMGRRAKQPPAKIRYDQSHPTVSFRVTRELKDRLESCTTAKGMSFADFIKEALGVRERERSYEDSFRDGYRKGHHQGKRDEAAKCHIRCTRCGRRFAVTRAMVKKVTLMGSAAIECPAATRKPFMVSVTIQASNSSVRRGR